MVILKIMSSVLNNTSWCFFHVVHSRLVLLLVIMCGVLVVKRNISDELVSELSTVSCFMLLLLLQMN